MCFKRFLFIILSISVFSSLFAAEKIDDIISDSSAAVIENCSSDTVVALGVFETPVAEMSDYFYENMLSRIQAAGKSFKIIKREQLSLIDENDTVFDAAERLGADSIVFVTVDEYNDVQVKMLDSVTGEFIFLRFYDMQDTLDVVILLNGNKKKASIGLFLDINNYFSDKLFGMSVLSLDYTFCDKFLTGVKLSFANGEDRPSVMEVAGNFKYFVIPFSRVPYSGVFAEVQLGADEYRYDSGNVWAFTGGLSAGVHIEYKGFFAEAAINTGYPYMFKCVFSGGFRLHF